MLFPPEFCLWHFQKFRSSLARGFRWHFGWRKFLFYSRQPQILLKYPARSKFQSFFRHRVPQLEAFRDLQRYESEGRDPNSKNTKKCYKTVPNFNEFSAKFYRCLKLQRCPANPTPSTSIDSIMSMDIKKSWPENWKYSRGLEGRIQWHGETGTSAESDIVLILNEFCFQL